MMMKATAKPLRNIYEYVNAPVNFAVDSNSTTRVISLTWTYDGTGNTGFHVRYTTGALVPLMNQVFWTNLADQGMDAESAEFTMNPAPSLMPTRVQIQAFNATSTGAWIEGVVTTVS
jgi:hypothetical protein